MPTRSSSSSRRRYLAYRENGRTKGIAETSPTPRRHDALQSQRRRSALALLAALWRWLAGQRRTMALALLALSVATLASLVMPASTKVVIDYILTDSPGPTGIPEWLGLPEDRMALLWILTAALTFAALLTAVFGLWGRWLMTRMRLRMQALLRRRAFEHAVRLPLHRIHQLKSGGVASILRDDAGGAGQLLFSLIYNPWRAVLQLLGTLVILTAVDWRLLVGSIVLLPIVWYTHRTWINRIRPVYRDLRHTRQGIDAQSTEAFGGMRVVRAFNRERSEAKRFVGATHFMLRQELLAWWRSRAVDIAWQLLIPIASAGVLLYGGSQVLQGTLSIGDVIMFSTYLVMLLSPLETLAATATQIQNSLAGFDRTLDLLEEETEFEQDSDAIPTRRQDAQGRITLDHVWFRYPGQGAEPDFVLQEINLDAAPGEIIALVGPSGAGKTTLCNLVARFFDPTEGSISMDGRDLRTIELNSYRRLLGVVEQDVFLFDGSVAENIGFARPGVSFEQIRAAAGAADADQFIQRFSRGYETIIGERGVRLSGGQRQRIAIARALLADPKILILDEATSNLDSESERLVQRSMFRLMEGRTCFVIAHRLSTIRHADRIAVLDAGRMIEVGSHDELLARGGRYAEMLRLQLGQTSQPAETQPL